MQQQGQISGSVCRTQVSKLEVEIRNDCNAAVLCYHTQASMLTAGVQPLSVQGCCPMHFFGRSFQQRLIAVCISFWTLCCIYSFRRRCLSCYT